MGTMMMAKCECGYESGNLFVGGGRTNFRKMDAQPALCSKCRKVVLVNILMHDQKCPGCKNPVKLYGDPALMAGDRKENDSKETPISRPGARFRCPKCGQNKLRFESTGFWD